MEFADAMERFVKYAKSPFNSLFEMQLTQLHICCRASANLSILYLRCEVALIEQVPPNIEEISFQFSI